MPRPKLLISPLEGEMASRPEGVVVSRNAPTSTVAREKAAPSRTDPLCPAGHLPLKGGDWPSSAPSPITSVWAKSKLLISPLRGRCRRRRQRGSSDVMRQPPLSQERRPRPVEPTPSVLLANLPLKGGDWPSSPTTVTY
ncbi:MAG: hypothetical protein E5Y65_18720 [Mesorhizobium sp.]|nr:MAG: hypothetical protein E5Y65_18720 [Mesorhizobium sp.]TIM00318.1 MAG: hypothetical protein E5Y64_17780 [Mesorhizobium sp.]